MEISLYCKSKQYLIHSNVQVYISAGDGNKPFRHFLHCGRDEDISENLRQSGKQYYLCYLLTSDIGHLEVYLRQGLGERMSPCKGWNHTHRKYQLLWGFPGGVGDDPAFPARNAAGSFGSADRQQ